MAFDGKGMFIWQIPDCEGGNVNAIVQTAKQAGLSHLNIKIANGIYTFNVSRTNQDYAAPLVQALHANGMQAWGWHYVYGSDPVGEAKIAIRRIRELGLDGYAIDAEGEYKQSGRDAAARRFMSEMRASLPNFPISLCSYRYPSYHPQIPWREFLEKCDLNMPQVYWEQSHNPGAQLNRTVREFQALSPSRPICPVGSAYGNAGWVATAADIKEFLDTARSLNLKAPSLYSWDYARKKLPDVWNAIASYPWGGTSGGGGVNPPPVPTPNDMPQRLITALNTRDAYKVVQLFTPDGVHISATETIQGAEAIRNWYLIFLNVTLSSATFMLTGTSGTGSTRHFTWQATSPKGRVLNGYDTIGLRNDLIAYHYTQFTITR